MKLIMFALFQNQHKALIMKVNMKHTEWNEKKKSNLNWID